MYDTGSGFHNCCSFSPKTLLYTVSKLPPGTFRPALKPSAAASALAPKGCGTVAASAPKPPFYIRFQNCSSARFARPRNPLLHLAAASAVAKLLQLQPQNILSIRRLRNCRFPTLKRSCSALRQGLRNCRSFSPKTSILYGFETAVRHASPSPETLRCSISPLRHKGCETVAASPKGCETVAASAP